MYRIDIIASDVSSPNGGLYVKARVIGMYAAAVLYMCIIPYFGDNVNSLYGSSRIKACGKSCRRLVKKYIFI